MSNDKNLRATLQLVTLSVLIATCSLFEHSAGAVVAPRPLGSDQRIKIINYMPNAVFSFTGHYMYQSIIEFGQDEEISTISMGTPTPWQLVPRGNRIFLKPIEDEATTNMTVVTNKRMYFFEMHAKEAQSVKDSELAFIVKFVYPEDTTFQAVKSMSTSSGPNTLNPSLYNFNYTISGNAQSIDPTQIFDDGEFTYFKFRDINSDLPAVFMINLDNTEALVNYRMENGYMVVERVHSRFTLRHGNNVLCVYNEDYKNYIKTTK